MSLAMTGAITLTTLARRLHLPRSRIEELVRRGVIQAVRSGGRWACGLDGAYAAIARYIIHELSPPTESAPTTDEEEVPR